PLALPHHFVQIRRWTYLNRSKSILKVWLLRDKLNGMIEVSCLKDLNAAKLFLGFRIGTVGRRDFAVFPVQRQRNLRGLKRHFGNKMSVGAQMVIMLKACVEHCVSLVLGHPFEFPWLDVSQTDEFHPFLLVSCDSESRSSSFCYQIVVRETENRQLLHFFSLIRGICGSLMRSNGGRKLGLSVPRPCVFCKGGLARSEPGSATLLEAHTQGT